MDGFLKYLNHHMSKFTFVFICVLVFNSAVNAKEHSSVKEISISQKILGVLTERKFLMHLPKNFDFEDVYPVIFFLIDRDNFHWSLIPFTALQYLYCFPKPYV